VQVWVADTVASFQRCDFLEDRSVCSLNYTDRSGKVKGMNTKTGCRARTALRPASGWLAARQLFYEGGIHTVGIDRVIEHAGVAKASLYGRLRSKEELIAPTYKGGTRRARRASRRGLRAMPILENACSAVFDALGDLFAQPNFRGCAFARAPGRVAAG